MPVSSSTNAAARWRDFTSPPLWMADNSDSTWRCLNEDGPLHSGGIRGHSFNISSNMRSTLASLVWGGDGPMLGEDANLDPRFLVPLVPATVDFRFLLNEGDSRGIRVTKRAGMCRWGISPDSSSEFKIEKRVYTCQRIVGSIKLYAFNSPSSSSNSRTIMWSSPRQYAVLLMTVAGYNDVVLGYNANTLLPLRALMFPHLFASRVELGSGRTCFLAISRALLMSPSYSLWSNGWRCNSSEINYYEPR